MKKFLGVCLIGLAVVTVSFMVTACKTAPVKSQEATNEIISEEIIVGKGGEWELSGLLTLPKNAAGKIPAVVLVHGSGPQDMDETIYDNKPFKDIAEYLASQGIASIRYDKRTLVYPEKIVENFGDFTVNEETVEDAILAANLLRNDSRIDSSKIFLIGHSLGGIVAPRIDAEGGDFAGIILLAGSPRKLTDILLGQLQDQIANLSEAEKAIGQAQIDAIAAYFDAFMTMPDDQAKGITLIGVTGYYYKDLNSYPYNEYLQSTDKPVLIMQGEKDFQVYVDRDYALYQTLLAGKDNVTFKLYPGLNHLFMQSTSGTADEYAIASHVDSAVLDDLANWIKARN